MRCFLLCLIVPAFWLHSQNSLRAIVVDSATKAPIEFADIYNHYDYTTTNEDGSFLFTSKGDSVFIKRLGYHPLKSTFHELQKQGVILLTEASIELKEVVLTSEKDVYDRIKDSLETNYAFSPYEEHFMLRALLKKNDTILKLEDLSGKIKRQLLFASKKHPMPKRNYEVELLNMRKAGLKEDNIEFTLNDFHEIFHGFISIFMDRKFIDRKVENLPNSIKISFKKKDSLVKIDNNYNVEGYYIVNPNNMAIEEGMSITNRPNIDYEKSGPYRYRTPYFKVQTFFGIHENGKYSIKKAKAEFSTEVLNTKTDKKDIYNSTYIITTHDSFKELHTKKNVKVSKDIFRLKHPYNPDFWEKQNQLLLTNEMNDFIETLSLKENEYRMVSNIKKH